MQFAFDLISDLHAETWPDFDWNYRSTSQYCIVAGDIAKDIDLVRKTLIHLSNCYQAVFYIDGNDEHKKLYNDIAASYQQLGRTLKKIPDVVYLQSNVVIINGVAIIATNGWWTFDFDPSHNDLLSEDWFIEHFQVEPHTVREIKQMAKADAIYLMNTVKRMQLHTDVKKIIVVTHTLPKLSLVDHDIDLVQHYKMNTVGNPYLNLALGEDLEKKIAVWCLGHYHGKIDRMIDNVRFVNNCRGRGDTKWRQDVYHPLRIEINV